MFEVESNECENRIHTITREGKNYILEDVYEVNDGILPAHKNKPRARGHNDLTIYKVGCRWDFIYHRRVSVYWIDAEKLMV